MDTASTAPETDSWSRWLLIDRHANDPVYQKKVMAIVHAIADRLLDAAKLRRGTVLADIGAGDGLITERAMGRTGGDLRAILTDISPALLQAAAIRMTELGHVAQCTFLRGSAENLSGIGDGSVDTVASRAVLAYVADKPAALAEFWRILKPGGMLSMAEPIFQDEAFETHAMKKWLDSAPENESTAFSRLYQRIKAAQYPSTDETLARSPLTNFCERDLVRMVQKAGFNGIHLELHIDIRPALITTWETYLNSSPHPLAPPPGEILAREFSVQERALFEREMRPRIETDGGTNTDLVAYVSARKPG